MAEVKKGKAKKMEGRSLYIFIGGKAVALTTDTTISMKADTEDVTTKDDGLDGVEEISKASWTASNDSFYSADERTADVVGKELMKMFWQKKPVEVVVGEPINKADSEVPDEGWTVPTANGWKGTAIITGLDIKATVKQKATCSLSLQGQGPLTELTA